MPGPPRMSAAMAEQRKESGVQIMRMAGVSTVDQLYLNQDASNRLVLSLRCGMAEEVDFALERLVQVSSVEPQFLAHSSLPSLASDLMLVLADAIDGLDAGSRDHHRLRRGLEAMVVMRNIALDSLEHRMALAKGTRLADLTVRALKRGLPDAEAVCAGELIATPLSATDAHESDELRLSTLDLLECVVVSSPPIIACFPPFAGSSQHINDLIGQHAAPDDPRRQLYALVVAYAARSPDRAVMLSAFRVLAGMYSAPPLLAEPLLAHGLAGVVAERAIELMPLLDADISQAVLEHLYLYSTYDDNATRLAARVEVRHDVRALCAVVRRYGVRETLEMDIALHLQAPVKPDARPRGPMRLSPVEAQPMFSMQAREATLYWMHTVFEPSQGQEVTQVQLWQAYKEEWDSHPQMVGRIMQAGDMIKMTTEAIPGAMPSVTLDKRYIISNMSVRIFRPPPPESVVALIFCNWTTCLPSFTTTSAAELYRHLIEMHLPFAGAGAPCGWRGCPYVIPADAEHPLEALSRHLRVHAAAPRPVHEPAPVHPNSREVIRYHLAGTMTADAPASTNAIGPGLMALLVLRNIALAVRAAHVAPAGGSGGTSGPATRAMAPPEGPSIFDALHGSGPSAAASASMMRSGSGEAALDESVREAAVEYGLPALEAIEAQLLELATSHRQLHGLAAEALEAISAARAPKPSAQSAHGPPNGGAATSSSVNHKLQPPTVIAQISGGQRIFVDPSAKMDWSRRR